MKNSLFLIVYFLFLPLVSYSQVVSHSFEDSVLTVFVKPSSLQSETDTIYSNGVPKKINFVFEDIDSIDSYSKNVVMVRGRRLFAEPQIDNNIYTITPREFTNWEGDRFVICVQIPSKKTLDTLGFCTNLYIIPPATLRKMRLPQKQRDSVERLENHIAFIESYEKYFKELKEPQENLTEKDKRKIAKIYSTIKLTDGDKAKIGNHKLIDKGEIANIHWLEYLHFLLDNSLQTQYLANLPDSMIWNKLYNSYELDYHYLRNPAYRYYPVVGITYQQAQQYCIWRGNVVNEIVNEKYKNSDYEIIVYYRLPTKEEWEYAATKDDLNKQFGGYSTKGRYTEKEKRKIYNSAKEFSDSTYSIERVKLDMKNYFESDTSYRQMFNYRVDYQKPYFTQNTPYFYDGILTNWIFSYKPTSQFKLYNIFGNVAEMTSEKGIAKGGSFYHTLEECAADRVQLYDSPQAWLGFRCVAEVVVRKKDGK